MAAAYMGLLYFLSSISDQVAPDELIGMAFAWVEPKWQNLLHIPAYGVLAFLWYGYGHSRKLGLWPAAVLATMCAGCYGVIDEIHQLSVPGRFASWTDVSSNWIGAIAGAAVGTLTWRRREV